METSTKTKKERRRESKTRRKFAKMLKLKDRMELLQNYEKPTINQYHHHRTEVTSRGQIMYLPQLNVYEPSRFPTGSPSTFTRMNSLR